VGRLVMGVGIGVFCALLWVDKLVRRHAETDRARADLWPRPEDRPRSYRSYAAVWDFSEVGERHRHAPGAPGQPITNQPTGVVAVVEPTFVR